MIISVLHAVREAMKLTSANKGDIWELTWRDGSKELVIVTGFNSSFGPEATSLTKEAEIRHRWQSICPFGLPGLSYRRLVTHSECPRCLKVGDIRYDDYLCVECRKSK